MILNYYACRNDIEITIHHIWCGMFQQSQISHSANIFTIGGHSLLLMQLYQLYKTTFHLKTNCFSIADLFQHPTISDHARFIHHAIDMKEQIDDHWCPLHLIQGKKESKLLVIIISCTFFDFLVGRASFAQERIVLDEQIRFSSKR